MDPSKFQFNTLLGNDQSNEIYFLSKFHNCFKLYNLLLGCSQYECYLCTRTSENNAHAFLSLTKNYLNTTSSQKDCHTTFCEPLQLLLKNYRTSIIHTKPKNVLKMQNQSRMRLIISSVALQRHSQAMRRLGLM